MQPFSVVLCENRKRLNISQKRLAVWSGVDHSYISRLENGNRTTPTRDAVLKLADALECTATERDRLLVAAGYLPDSQFLRDVIDQFLGKQHEAAA